MGNNWETVCIDDLKSPEKYSCVGGPFGSSLSRKHYVDSGVPVIRGVNLSGDSFSESDFVFVSTEKALELQRNMAFRGDLVFTQRGTLGQVALIPDDSNYEQYVVSQSQMKLTINSEIANPYFLYSYFRTKEAKTLIEKSAIVGGVPHINLGILKEFKLKLPPLRVQKQVANISRLLDDKMHLNRQINQTLEQMAQALFKSWFVDFDPVIDNALDAGFFEQNSELPEDLLRRAEQRKIVREQSAFKPLPAETRQLFPAAFEECEEPSLGLGGWVPQGWVVASLEDTIDFLEGPGIRNWQYTNSDNGVRFINIRCIQNGDLTLDTANRISDEEAFGKYSHFQLEVDDIVVSTSGTLGRYAYVREEHLPLSLNTSVIRFRPIKGISTLHFIAGYIATDLQLELEKRASGSVQRNFGPSHLKKINLLLPDFKSLEAHNQISDVLFRKRQCNLKESNQLNLLRDTLLPKLISGELRLSDDGTLTSGNTDC